MESFSIDRIEFLLDHRPGPQRGRSEKDRFILVKSKRVLDFYESLIPSAPKNILEIGMAEGGSLVYYDKLFSPTTLVGIDIRKDPIDALEQYRETRPYIKTFYGRSQDLPHTRAAAQSSFPDGIDLVVDDASHLYDKTLATFESLFPLVRAGGLYVIEDWAWSHRPAYQSPDSTWSNRPALTNLVFSLVVMSAACRVIDSVTVNDSLVQIRKGKGVLPQAKLDVSAFLRGREMAQL
jgi:predicted O-methyltransferase YrrM